MKNDTVKKNGNGNGNGKGGNNPAKLEVAKNENNGAETVMGIVDSKKPINGNLGASALGDGRRGRLPLEIEVGKLVRQFPCLLKEKIQKVGHVGRYTFAEMMARVAAGEVTEEEAGIPNGDAWRKLEGSEVHTGEAWLAVNPTCKVLVTKGNLKEIFETQINSFWDDNEPKKPETAPTETTPEAPAIA